MRRRLTAMFFAVILMALARGVSSADDITIDALIDKQEISIEDTIYLSVTVKGIRSSDTTPKVSGGGNFDVSYRGSNSKFTMINGKVSSNVDFNYMLEPKKAGTFFLPPVTFEHKGKAYKTAAIKLTVKNAVQGDVSRDVFVEAEVSNENPYVNEQIIFRFRFYTGVQVANPSYDEPGFDNFIAEQLGGSAAYNKIVSGRRYNVNEVKYALFPLKSGEYSIPSIKTRVDVLDQAKRRSRRSLFAGYGEYKTKRFRTEEIKLTVKPLPPYNKTDMPFSNLIGEFKVNAALGKQVLNVNDSTTLTVVISGTGNIKDAVLPASPDMEEFKTYDDKPTERIKVTKGGVMGKKIFKRAFITLKEGRLTIPPIKFAYFDTKTSDYVVLSTTEYSLKVGPPDESEELNLVEMVGRTTTKEAVRIIGRDVVSINTELESLKDETPMVAPVLGAFSALLPGFIYFAFVVRIRRREKHESDESILRRKRAFKRFKSSTNRLNKLIKEDDKEFYRLLLGSFKKYIGDKFNIVGTALTIDELSRILSEKKMKEDMISGIKDALKKLESAQFASVTLSSGEKKAVVKMLSAAVKKIEKKN